MGRVPYKTWTSSVVTVPDLNEQIRDNGNINVVSIAEDGHLKDSSILSVVADYTVVSTDDWLLCSGTFMVTLLSAVGMRGRRITVKNAGTGVITMGCTGTEVIDNAAASLTNLYAKDSLTFESDNANWWIV